MGTSIDMVFIEGGARQRERDSKKEIARERERERENGIKSVRAR